MFSSIDCSFRSADGPVLVLNFFFRLSNSASCQLIPMPFMTLSLVALTGDSQYVSGEEVY